MRHILKYFKWKLQNLTTVVFYITYQILFDKFFLKAFKVTERRYEVGVVWVQDKLK
jgi:hypothetical protein